MPSLASVASIGLTMPCGLVRIPQVHRGLLRHPANHEAAVLSCDHVHIGIAGSAVATASAADVRPRRYKSRDPRRRAAAVLRNPPTGAILATIVRQKWWTSVRCHNRSATVQPGMTGTGSGEPGDLAGVDEGGRIAVEGDQEVVDLHLRMVPHRRYGRHHDVALTRT